MTIKMRHVEKFINAVMISLFMLTISAYACFAQTVNSTAVNFTNDDPMRFVKSASQNIALENGINIEAQATRINPSVNGPFEELKPVVAPRGNRLYFSRINHPNNTMGQSDQEDIWYSDYNQSDDTWSEPALLPGMLNNSGPNYVNNISVTGDTIILGNEYLKKGKMRSGLSYSINVNGQWSTPQAITIEDNYNMSAHANAFVSLKEGVILQSVMRGDTYGDRDIYVSFWNGETATAPINIGGVVNTDMEESSPFLAADNRTLYFASKGHNGFGGYDIYVTRRIDDTWTNWTKPVNMGPAVNSKLDDEFFTLSQCGHFAIFSRQVSVHNTDIYKIAVDELYQNHGAKPVWRRKSDEEGVHYTALAGL